MMLDLATETFALPIWAAALIAASFAAAVLFAFAKPVASDVFRTSVRAGVVFVGTVLIVWIFLDRTALSDREAERRAFDARAGEVALRAVVPGSPLACLDAIAGDTVESACERALFANPEVIAAAVSYTSARLDLLARSIAFAGRDPSYGTVTSALRQALESDRFGIVAQVLSLRDSCTPTQCDTFALLSDTSRVRANLADRTFDGYVARYAANWMTRDARIGPPLADVPSGPGISASTAPTVTGALNGVAPSPVPQTAAPAKTIGALSHYDFPSASSIPAVSIMTPEPDGPAVSASTSNPPTPQRKPAAPARAANAPSRQTPQGATTSQAPAPTQLTPQQPSAVEPGHSLQ